LTQAPKATLVTPIQPTNTATPERVCTELHGKIVPGQINSDLLDDPLNIEVYLPPCYDASGAISYPMLILMHGMNNNESQWLRMDVNGVADSLILSKQVVPFIIVLPREDDTYAYVGDSSFPDAIVNVLIPWMDSHYATCTDRICRAIGGLSRGSGWALRLGLTNWELFGSIGAHSISPFYGDANRLPDWINQIPADSLPRLYMDIGKDDMVLQEGMDIDSILTSVKYEHEWIISEGGHNEDYWHSHLKDYLLWYAEPWAQLKKK
jgi:enterochelin esterase-like enzyme